MIRSRPLHKWIGIVVGIILLMWSVTGIVLMIPGPRPAVNARVLDVHQATVSPAQAALAAGGDSALNIRAMSLIQIHDQLVYRIDTGRRPILIGASSGQRLEIGAELAEAIAREGTGGTSAPATVDLVLNHDGLYTTGSLPVWRVRFGDGVPAHVTQQDGTLVPPGSRSRFRAVSHDLHNFSILRELIPANWFYRSSAILLAAVSVISIVTGYWLAWPRRRRVRTTEPMSIATNKW